MARALVVLVREEHRAPELDHLLERCLAFVEQAQVADGRFRNRRSVDGAWTDGGGSDDTHGRALFGLGVTARGPSGDLSERALQAFERGAGFRTSSPRACASAALGAAELLAARPGHPPARALLTRAAAGLGLLGRAPGWLWPERRLAWGNALLPEARIAAGVALADDRLLREGLELLAWLVDVESAPDGHFSFAPVEGWAPGEPRPGFDQQPVEAGAMADACARAFAATGDGRWADDTLRAARWFLGDNDVGAPLLDRGSGGCRDGLLMDGVNLNEGAESTIALITALQQARVIRADQRAASWARQGDTRRQAAARRAATSAAPSSVAAPTERSAAP